MTSGNEKPSEPRTEQAIKNAQIKEIVEGYYQEFEGKRTQAAIQKTKVDILKSIATRLGVKPTPAAKLHSKKKVKGKKTKEADGTENPAD